MISQYSRSSQKVGGQPPKVVSDLLRKRHPTVRLMWADKQQRWCLVEWPAGKPPVMLRVLAGPRGEFVAPTLVNTVFVLDRMHPSNFSSARARERLLAELDRNEESAAIERRARDRIRAGSSDLWNAISGRKLIVPRPSR